MIMRTLKVIAAAMLILSPIAIQAATCEQFKAGIVEGAARYQVPAPKFRLDYVNSADADIQYWTIHTFGDVRAAMSCWHGSVKTFMADANDSEITSSLHLLLLMGIGLQGHGTEWHPALDFRDQLVRAARNSPLKEVARLIWSSA